MKTIILSSVRSKTYLLSLIEQQPVDGTITVEIKKTNMSSTAKQTRLCWLWYTEISQSGLGQDDTKESVHIRAKWMFARPILLRDCEVFGAIYAGFSEMVRQIPDQSRRELWLGFAQDYISTESMSRGQRAEYMTELQRYWVGKGVELSNPATQGLDEYLGGGK